VSEPIDSKTLEEYLKGNSDLSQRYRELGSDAVPPELDQRVLAAARDAVANEGARRSRSWLRWSAPVALAASAVLVVTVVLEGGLQDQKLATLPQAPAETQEAPAAAAPAAAPPTSDDKARDATERKLADELRKGQSVAQDVAQPAREFVQSPPPASLAAPEPAPAAKSVAKAEAERLNQAPAISEVAVTGSRLRSSETAATSPVTSVTQDELTGAVQPAPEADSSREVEEIVLTGARRARSVGRTAGPRNTISNHAFRSDRPTADEQANHSDPAAWLEEIRDLRRAGQTADADREWDRFRAAFPDFHVAEDDLARRKP
jgi:hypothetical protein